MSRTRAVQPAPRTPRRRGRDDRGASLSVEAVLLVPALVIVLAVMVGGWRIWTVRGEVRQAAQASARAASLQHSGSEARVSAQAVANAQLQQVPCDNRSVSVDTTEFNRPGGQPAEVRVSISCRVALHDLLVPGLPGVVDAGAESSSALDRFRERRP